MKSKFPFGRLIDPRGVLSVDGSLRFPVTRMAISPEQIEWNQSLKLRSCDFAASPMIQTCSAGGNASKARAAMLITLKKIKITIRRFIFWLKSRLAKGFGSRSGSWRQRYAGRGILSIAFSPPKAPEGWRTPKRSAFALAIVPCASVSWTAAASAARRRFRTHGEFFELRHVSSARKRCRRSASAIQDASAFAGRLGVADLRRFWVGKRLKTTKNLVFAAFLQFRGALLVRITASVKSLIVTLVILAVKVVRIAV